MTKREITLCESLIDEALKELEQGEKDLMAAELNGHTIPADSIVKLRSGDQHYGYAQGIHHALVVLHYKSDKMKLLSEKL